MPRAVVVDPESFTIIALIGLLISSFFRSVVICSLALMVSQSGLAQPQRVDDAYVHRQITKAKRYYFVLLKSGPTESLDSVTAEQNQRAHLRYLFTLKVEGKLLLIGPFLEEGALCGIEIFDAKDKGEVTALLDRDPHVKAGSLGYEVREWFGVPGQCLR